MDLIFRISTGILAASFLIVVIILISALIRNEPEHKYNVKVKSFVNCNDQNVNEFMKDKEVISVIPSVADNYKDYFVVYKE